MFRITYVKDDGGNYRVTNHRLHQTIILLPGFFRKQTGVSSDVIIGYCDLEFERVQAWGFNIPTRKI